MGVIAQPQWSFTLGLRCQVCLDKGATDVETISLRHQVLSKGLVRTL